MLSSLPIDISHQEMERIIDCIEKCYNYFAYNDEGPTGCEWLPCYGTCEMLCEELGYEDISEFEDAIKNNFTDFIKILPNIITKEENGKIYLKVKEEPKQCEWVGKSISVNIITRADLWRVCLKSKYGCIEIPHIEFVISSDGRRAIDTFYNHICNAKYNLGNYMSRCSMTEGDKCNVTTTLHALTQCLDVEYPFTIIINDPSGISEVKPMDGVSVTKLIDTDTDTHTHTHTHTLDNKEESDIDTNHVTPVIRIPNDVL
eukprot:GHVR01108154.1.p1 GENE.GHVR01108154.1~~GHVR01108154.1.p1  ORF type:complete len:259 (+),score=74.65 GHVR01108154.1:139-915(+)